MKTLIAASAVSVLSLIVLIAIYIDHFGEPFLGLSPGAASAVAMTLLAVNSVVAVLAIAFRARGPSVAWPTTALALAQVAAVLMTG